MFLGISLQRQHLTDENKHLEGGGNGMEESNIFTHAMIATKYRI